MDIHHSHSPLQVSTAFTNAARKLKKTYDFALFSSGKYDANLKGYPEHPLESVVKGAKPPAVVVTEDGGKTFKKCTMTGKGDKQEKLEACLENGDGLAAL